MGKKRTGLWGRWGSRLKGPQGPRGQFGRRHRAFSSKKSPGHTSMTFKCIMCAARPAVDASKQLLGASTVFSASSMFRCSASICASGGQFLVFRVFHFLESAQARYDVTVGRLEKHYRVRLSADANRWRSVAAADLLLSPVRPTAVHGLPACSAIHTQRATSTRENMDSVDRTSGARGAPDRILKGIAIRTRCAQAPERHATPLLHTEGASGPKASNWRL